MKALFFNMRKNRLLPLIGLLALSFLFCRPATSVPDERNQEGDTLEGAISKLVESLHRKLPSFPPEGGSVLLFTDANNKSDNAFSAILNEKARAVFMAAPYRAEILTERALPFPASPPDSRTLSLLDGYGIDAVVWLSVEVRGTRAVLRAKALTLEGGSLAPLLFGTFNYPEAIARQKLTDSPSWSILIHRTEQLRSKPKGWQKETIVVTDGRALDFAVGDIDGDKDPDFALLFADRIEIHLAIAMAMEEAPYVFALDDLPQRLIKPRIPDGQAFFCEDDFGYSLYVGTNHHEGGYRFQWDGEALYKEESFAKTPVACDEQGVLAAEYEKGTHRFNGKLFLIGHDAESELGNLGRPFVSVLQANMTSPLFFVAEDGRLLRTLRGDKVGLQCGRHPALLTGMGDTLFACSQAVAEPKTDVIEFHRLDTMGMKIESAAKPVFGAYYAIEAISNTFEEVVFAIWYDKEIGTTLEKLTR